MSRYFKKRNRRKRSGEIDFEQVFFDSKNTAGMNQQQMQGVIEKPIGKWTLFAISSLFMILIVIFSFRLYQIQIVQGEELYARASNNAQSLDIIFNKRGVIYDRNGKELVWNESVEGLDFPKRKYTPVPGFAHLLGYVTYPQSDSSGKYFQFEYKGVSGIESFYNELLNGQLGFREKQVTTRGVVTSDSLVQEPINGLNITLTIDAVLQERLHKELARYVQEQEFDGASGVIMDVQTGELLAMTSVPEYDSNVLADGEDRALIGSYNVDSQKPFLNRSLGGTYAPGSVIKPFIAAGIVDRDIVNPSFRLFTNGKLVILNRFGGPATIFRDARNNGTINLREAIAKSSNIFFFTFGGGVPGKHTGLGITGMKEYLDMFGFAEKTGLKEFREQSGFVPTPEWKQDTFGENWLLGDTYFTAIGQYSFLATPLQLVTAVGAIATDGRLLTPQLVTQGDGQVIPEVRREIDISKEDFDVVQEGMRMVITHPKGTARSLNLPYVTVAAKTGTAERGVNRSKWNSWTIGYWPYENPKYAFVVMAENGPAGNRLGISRTMTRMFQGMFEDGITNYFD